MTEKSKKAAPHKIFDVTKPGKTAPSASSKPIIITNRPVLQDPMMVEDAAPEGQATLLKMPTKITIRPLSDDNTADSTEDKQVATETPEAPPVEKLEPVSVPDLTNEQTGPKSLPTATKAPEVDLPKPAEITTPPAPQAAEPEPKQATPAVEPVAATPTAAEAAPESDDTSSSSEATEDQPADASQPATVAKAAEAAARKQAERAAELTKLAESHKYYLPINQVEKRKNKRYALLGVLLIVVLAVAWADISLDAGIIHLNGIKPLTHFFSN